MTSSLLPQMPQAIASLVGNAHCSLQMLPETAAIKSPLLGTCLLAITVNRGAVCKALKPQLGVMMHTCDPSIREVEAGALGVHGQPLLQRKVEARLGYKTWVACDCLLESLSPLHLLAFAVPQQIYLLPGQALL